LVELHGGTIRAESLGEGQGATFTVQMPLLKTTKRKKTNFTPSPDRTDRIINFLMDYGYLVVDDEPGLLELLKQF
jgi:hypothetical protein